MSDVSIEMSLPLDADGFLRRECPNCERQFKWRSTSLDEGLSEDAEVEGYYCPYCYQSALTDTWWTKEQVEHAKHIALKQVLEPGLRNLQGQINQTNRSGRLVEMEASTSEFPETGQLVEMEDMVQVDFPCHPEEPLKIDGTWEQEIACLICGIRYPVSLVKQLPE